MKLRPTHRHASSDPDGSHAAGSPRVDEDARLLERIAAGDDAAFEELYHRYHRRLMGYLLRILGRPGVVEEVLDDAMLAVWQGAHRFDGRSRASTWIFGITHHKALKALDKSRRDASRDAGEPPDPEVEPAAEHRQPDVAAARSELRRKLRSALDALSPVQRAVVELTFFYGYSYPEVAKIVGCPVGTVKTRMFHARRLLKERLPQLGLRQEIELP